MRLQICSLNVIIRCAEVEHVIRWDYGVYEVRQFLSSSTSSIITYSYQYKCIGHQFYQDHSNTAVVFRRLQLTTKLKKEFSRELSTDTIVLNRLPGAHWALYKNDTSWKALHFCFCQWKLFPLVPTHLFVSLFW